MIKLIGSEDYYPTPESLLDKITIGMDWKKVEYILEPSAGKGNIAEYVSKKKNINNRWSYLDTECNIDCIEIEPEFRAILKDKKFFVVHDDFLTFHTYKHYDLIFMNPPFSAGAKHLLKAIELQETSGGAIICILNAETLRNPYTNERKDLARRLESYNAEITYYENAFSQAERPSDVEIAVIKIIIPEKKQDTFLFENLREKNYQEYEQRTTSELSEADFVKAFVALYNREIEWGLRLYREYLDFRAGTLDNTSRISFLATSDDECTYSNHYRKFMVNDYVREVRRKYWDKLFGSPKFMRRMTSKLRDQYLSQVNKFVRYDFSYWNIKTIQEEISRHLIQAVENSILELFDELSHEHYWDEDRVSGNVHYYNGWKTNSSYKINKRVIIPLQYFDEQYINTNQESAIRKLADIERVLIYLDGGDLDKMNIDEVFEAVTKMHQTRNIPCQYFTVTFYKKGTCHITFTNEKLLKKFNIFGSQKKGWLPKGYARKTYQEMNAEERDVIESFEGQASYMETMSDSQYYLFDVSSSLPMLGGGENHEAKAE